jgi:membrane protease subunit HflK
MKSRRWYLWLPVLLVVAYLLTSVRLIQPNERAVVRRFGHALPDKPRPGLFIGLPWGMDRVDRVQVDQVQSASFGYRNDDLDTSVTPEGQYLTGDRNLVDVRVVVNYAVDDQQDDDYRALEEYLEQSSVNESVLERVGESVLGEWLAGRNIEGVLLLSDRIEVQGRFRKSLAERIAPYRLGVKIQSVDFVLREVPSQVKDAFDDVTRAIQERDTRTLEARQYESQILSAARSDADRLHQEAEVFYEDQIRKAQVDEKSFALHLEKAPKPGKERDDYLQLIWWQEVGAVLIEMGKQRRIQDVDPFVTRNGLEIVLPMSMRGGK